MTTLDEMWIGWTNTSIVKFSLNFRAPFGTSTFTVEKSIVFLDVHTKDF